MHRAPDLKEQLDGVLYGVLVRQVAELHLAGEHWDVSRALGDSAPALQELASQLDKDFGQRVRTRRQELGLPVALAGKVLPLRTTQLPWASPAELGVLDVDAPDTEEERAAWRVRLAERRMREAYLALEEANQHSVPEWGWAQLEATFQHEVQVYAAALAAAEAVTQGQEDAGSPAEELVPPPVP